MEGIYLKIEIMIAILMTSLKMAAMYLITHRPFSPGFFFRTGLGCHVSNFARALVVMLFILYKMAAILMTSKNGGHILNFAIAYDAMLNFNLNI